MAFLAKCALLSCVPLGTASSPQQSLRGLPAASSPLHGRRAQGADMTSCGTGLYCGSWEGDGEEHRENSCGAWPVKRKGFEQSAGFCFANEVYMFAGSERQAVTWFDQSQADNSSDKSFFVFHGCDGTGLMMGDCAGDTFYIEQFGPLSRASVPLGMPPDSSCQGGWCSHSRPEAFYHPGSGSLYSWYNAGMWTTGDGLWPDQLAGKTWWSNMGLPNISTLGPVPGLTAFAVMYPWVCDTTNQDWSWFWGGRAPFGNDTHSVKCYYDNEPWDNDHWHSTLIPPVWQAFKFYKDNASSQVWGWMLAEKKADSPSPVWYDSPKKFVLDFWPQAVW